MKKNIFEGFKIWRGERVVKYSHRKCCRFCSLFRKYRRDKGAAEKNKKDKEIEDGTSAEVILC